MMMRMCIYVLNLIKLQGTHNDLKRGNLIMYRYDEHKQHARKVNHTDI